MSTSAEAPIRPQPRPEAEPEDDALRREWPAIRALFKRTTFAAIATVSEDGAPRVTPVGSVSLHPTEPRGYYHPLFVKTLRKNLRRDGRFEMLVVDVGPTTWLKALARGRFADLVAARLVGRVDGPPRPITEEEDARWRRKMRPVRWTKGYDLLWSNVPMSQDLVFEAYRPVRLGPMPHGRGDLAAAQRS